ncbi:hypothetical protein FB451DRAFT_1298034 [Mycena latifolia]|nr:hypothetical protein FB451DRAFT_1298034 [Mycena latifolia]
MSTARDTVMSTSELLERILAQLPLRYLLVAAPLVCKAWQAIITLSPTLQRALFFQPDPSPRSDSEPVRNPLLVEMFPPFFAGAGKNRWSWSGQASTIMAMPWSKAPDAFKRKEASWRRMLVTQPPAQTMIVTETCHGQIGDYEQRAVLHDLSLRMGFLYDLAVPLIDRVASSFCIHWHHEPDRDSEGDLTLAVIYTSQCRVDLAGTLDKRFYSDGAEPVDIDFVESG